ncbi:dhhc zinc finger domain-containing protein [Cystoisospora suis]|uniref:Palmitoyltransferase n=1 Tax=Cystoisospora suis TaxID=483139 RepID=A0A2C6KU23_9APIC|nr:dhhc zinc finger domain-containing protein [Cystoisospora suis]
MASFTPHHFRSLSSSPSSLPTSSPPNVYKASSQNPSPPPPYPYPPPRFSSSFPSSHVVALKKRKKKRKKEARAIPNGYALCDISPGVLWNVPRIGELRILYKSRGGDLFLVIGPHWRFSIAMLLLMSGICFAFLFVVGNQLSENCPPAFYGGLFLCFSSFISFFCTVFKEPGLPRLSPSPSSLLSLPTILEREEEKEEEAGTEEEEEDDEKERFSLSSDGSAHPEECRVSPSSKEEKENGGGGRRRRERKETREARIDVEGREEERRERSGEMIRDRNEREVELMTVRHLYEEGREKKEEEEKKLAHEGDRETHEEEKVFSHLPDLSSPSSCIGLKREEDVSSEICGTSISLSSSSLSFSSSLQPPSETVSTALQEREREGKASRTSPLPSSLSSSSPPPPPSCHTKLSDSFSHLPTAHKTEEEETELSSSTSLCCSSSSSSPPIRMTEREADRSLSSLVPQDSSPSLPGSSFSPSSASFSGRCPHPADLPQEEEQEKSEEKVFHEEPSPQAVQPSTKSRRIFFHARSLSKATSSYSSDSSLSSEGDVDRLHSSRRERERRVSLANTPSSSSSSSWIEEEEDEDECEEDEEDERSSMFDASTAVSLPVREATVVGRSSSSSFRVLGDSSASLQEVYVEEEEEEEETRRYYSSREYRRKVALREKRRIFAGEKRSRFSYSSRLLKKKPSYTILDKADDLYTSTSSFGDEEEEEKGDSLSPDDALPPSCDLHVSHVNRLRKLSSSLSSTSFQRGKRPYSDERGRRMRRGEEQEEEEGHLSSYASSLRSSSSSRFCRYCKIIPPRGSYHCEDCRVCIEGYDHHCPWTSKCIGKGNAKEFYAWLIFSLLTIFHYGLSAAFLGRKNLDESDENDVFKATRERDGGGFLRPTAQDLWTKNE